MHIHNALHGVGIGELDVMKKAAPQKGIGQFFFVVRRNKHQRAVLGANQFAGFVAVELHAVEFAQQVVGKLNVGFVNFINQQGHGLFGGKGLPQHAFDDVVVNVFHALTAIKLRQLAVTQAADGIVFV